MTSTDSRFKQDNTASNMCGFTLMNSQVGMIIAEVMEGLDNVEITNLVSMIRVDGHGKFEVVYSDIEEAAGEDEGWFDASEFEEAISTHYGRMAFLDDRAIMFANPEDAAEYIDFDLKPVY